MLGWSRLGVLDLGISMMGRRSGCVVRFGVAMLEMSAVLIGTRVELVSMRGWTQATRTSIQGMDISILRLSGHQFSTENEELMFIATSNCRDGMGRPLQHLMLGDLLPLSCQRARARIESHDRIDMLGRQCGRMWKA